MKDVLEALLYGITLVASALFTVGFTEGLPQRQWPVFVVLWIIAWGLLSAPFWFISVAVEALVRRGRS
jgi:hypothetical protein